MGKERKRNEILEKRRKSIPQKIKDGVEKKCQEIDKKYGKIHTKI